MEARAILRYARISPRKVSIVMDLIRNKPLDEALAILAETYTLVKLDTQPLERFQDIFFGSRHETMRICILNTCLLYTSRFPS